MKVTTNPEISYSLNMTPSEVRHLVELLDAVLRGNVYNPIKEQLFRDTLACIRDQVRESEGVEL